MSIKILGWPKIRLSFSIISYRKTQTSFWLNQYLDMTAIVGGGYKRKASEILLQGETKSDRACIWKPEHHPISGQSEITFVWTSSHPDHLARKKWYVWNFREPSPWMLQCFWFMQLGSGASQRWEELLQSRMTAASQLAWGYSIK